MPRLFLAIPVRLYNYEEIKKEFGGLLEGRWRDEEHLHITITFLGEHIQPDLLFEKLSAFDYSFQVSELTAFSYFNKSRVFVAVTQNSTLQSLYDRIQRFLGLEDGDLIPHVTLMRVKNITDSDMFFCRLATAPSGAIGVLESKLVLYQSILNRDGAAYKVLREWRL